MPAKESLRCTLLTRHQFIQMQVSVFFFFLLPFAIFWCDCAPDSHYIIYWTLCFSVSEVELSRQQVQESNQLRIGYSECTSALPSDATTSCWASSVVVRTWHAHVSLCDLTRCNCCRCLSFPRAHAKRTPFANLVNDMQIQMAESLSFLVVGSRVEPGAFGHGVIAITNCDIPISIKFTLNWTQAMI